MSEPGLRASDAERQRAAERLGAAAAEGRLTPEELEQRVERALRARTRDELDALLADLPGVDPRAPRRRRSPRRALRPELRAFLVTSLLLVAVWALSGAGYFWPVWPILGWGVFVLAPGGGCHGRRQRHRRAAA